MLSEIIVMLWCCASVPTALFSLLSFTDSQQSKPVTTLVIEELGVLKMSRELRSWAIWIGLSTVAIPIMLGLGEVSRLQQEANPPQQRTEREIMEGTNDAL